MAHDHVRPFTRAASLLSVAAVAGCAGILQAPFETPVRAGVCQVRVESYDAVGTHPGTRSYDEKGRLVSVTGIPSYGGHAWVNLTYDAAGRVERVDGFEERAAQD